MDFFSRQMLCADSRMSFSEIKLTCFITLFYLTTGENSITLQVNAIQSLWPLAIA